jgi:hypothetical protein
VALALATVTAAEVPVPAVTPIRIPFVTGVVFERAFYFTDSHLAHSLQNYRLQDLEVDDIICFPYGSRRVIGRDVRNRRTWMRPVAVPVTGTCNNLWVLENSNVILGDITVQGNMSVSGMVTLVGFITEPRMDLS